MCHGADSKCIVSDHTVLEADDVGSRRTAFLVSQGSAPQPIIQRRFPALKMRKIMIGQELFGRSKSKVGEAHLSQKALVLTSRASRGLLAGGLSNIALKRLKSSSGSAK